MIWPKITIIIPTLNSAKVLNHCLKSIQQQNYPQSKIKILIVDGGSTDATIRIAQKYKTKIINNPLKTAEAAKAVGIKKANSKYVALIDSDNILPQPNYLKKMVLPMEKDNKLIASEPIKFTYRSKAGFIERYSALIGANDPYAFVTKVYDRLSYLTNKWTDLKLQYIDKGQYIKVKLKPKQNIPTIGANGTVFRQSFLKKYFLSSKQNNYFFDIDIISMALSSKKSCLYIAKVKIGIIHSFCESSISKFIHKQQRRLIDYYQYQPIRHFNWSKHNQTAIIKFSVYSLSLIAPLFDSIRGFVIKPDPAWFFHLPACLITFFTYAQITILSKLKLLKPLSRQTWQQ
ncbi:hypothetical protein DRH14_00790 [Candidatus Shapirobacteria bacterium]|nr:MAG: hypothetical protein DRH14_00790 [Candidatus Shapirobacteria bacterium]